MKAIWIALLSSWVVASMAVATPGEEKKKKKDGGQFELVEVARSDRQWTGVAVSKTGRIFVSYPRWSPLTSISVAEIDSAGVEMPFPNQEWNHWEAGLPPLEHFVCVQSVYIDPDNNLWILDPANPMFQGVVEGGPKLMKVDLSTNRVSQQIMFTEATAPKGSYLNDVRVGTKEGVAYITDSGTGAIVVVDLSTGSCYRRLHNHPSTKSEGLVLTIEGKEWRMGGTAPEVHSDGIALDTKDNYLYYQALTGRSIYRIKTKHLRDQSMSEAERGEKVERLGEPGVSDGLALGPKGRIYLTSLEHNAIRRLTPKFEVEMVVQDPRLKWPDSFSIAADGTIYVTTSQIHLGSSAADPYRIFKLQAVVKQDAPE